MKNFTLAIISLLLVACGTKESTSNKSTESNDSTIGKLDNDSVNSYMPVQKIDIESLNGNIDLNMDISTLSLADIRILRNAFAARQGYCFMKADLRALFSTTSWYSEKMEERYWASEQDDNYDPISYSAEEQAFIEKLRIRENDLMAQNYIQNGDRKMANLNNIINLFQLEDIDSLLMNMLGKNGFAIVPNNNIQLFHVYEENDYNQFPNFVTTDMYMQLFHMYFGFVLRTLEEEQFIPILSSICKAMLIDMQDIAMTNTDESVKDLANFNATYYAIAYTALTNNKVTVQAEFEKFYKDELAHIAAAKDDYSDFLDYRSVKFPYSLFKPRGHYTRTEELKRYFGAMMWLQTAPFCLDNDEHLKRAILSAAVLSNSPNYGKETLKKYKAIMEPVNFIIGKADNVSFLDLAQLIEKNHYEMNDLLTHEESLEIFRKELKKVADAQNVIKPKQAASCVDKINFIPQRYLADNEILQELVDVENNVTKRGFPKGLDVMAALGSGSAENILINELKESENWSKYPQILAGLKNKMKDINWDETVYNKWIESLLALQKTNKRYPYFMQNTQWRKKDLNASLASWAELKHDAILYAEQPMAAECGGGGVPEPYTLGYVEPNTGYWSTVIELLDLTKNVLEQNELFSSEISRITSSMRENAQFLLSASEKELAGENLSEKEYYQIEFIGSTFEWISLDLVSHKDEYIDAWNSVKGPDKSVAVVADVYTANALNNPKRGILHVATGNVNDIYVVAEIEGYLYITKGAVFSYYEFPRPLGNRLTDEEWQKMLEKNEAKGIPNWIKEIIVPIDAPKSNEMIFYSSGC